MSCVRQLAAIFGRDDRGGDGCCDVSRCCDAIFRPAIGSIMIAADPLKRSAIWSRHLDQRELDRARAGIVEKSYRADELVFMRGDQFDYWCGVVSGLLRMGTVSRGGKSMG